MFSFYVLNFKTQLVLTTINADSYREAWAEARRLYPDTQLVVR